VAYQQSEQRWEERCQKAEAHGAAAEAKHLQAEEGRAKMEEETSGGLHEVWVKMAWPAQWMLDNFGRFGCFMFAVKSSSFGVTIRYVPRPRRSKRLWQQPENAFFVARCHNVPHLNCRCHHDSISV